jgi:hypothetical protein
MDGSRFVMVSPADYALSSPASASRSHPNHRPISSDLPQPPKTPTKLFLFTAGSQRSQRKLSRR